MNTFMSSGEAREWGMGSWDQNMETEILLEAAGTLPQDDPGKQEVTEGAGNHPLLLHMKA